MYVSVMPRKIKGQPEQVPLEPEVVEIIKELMVLSPYSEYLFAVTRHPYKNAMSSATINNALKAMFDRTGVTMDEFIPHDLRRTSATIMEDELDIPENVSDKALGHARRRVKRTYYKGGLLDQRREAQRKILDLIGSYILD